MNIDRVHVTRSRAKPGGTAQSDEGVIPFRSRKPPWLKVKAPGGPSYRRIEQLMRAKSGAFLNDEDRALIAAHGSFFVAFTVMELDGQNMLAVDTRTRNAALLTLSGEFPADVVMAGAVSVPESIPADVEGYCAHAWGDSWGNMLAVKQASIYVCRVSSTGGTQSVGIVDAGTGEPRGNVKLGGGKIDRVRVGSVIRVEGMGLTDKGLIRQPVCCREWLVE